MAQGPLQVQGVAVTAPVALAGDQPLSFQVGEDVLHGTLGDPDLKGDVT